MSGSVTGFIIVTQIEGGPIHTRFASTNPDFTWIPLATQLSMATPVEVTAAWNGRFEIHQLYLSKEEVTELKMNVAKTNAEAARRLVNIATVSFFEDGVVLYATWSSPDHSCTLPVTFDMRPEYLAFHILNSFKNS